MKKQILICLSIISCLLLLAGCSAKENAKAKAYEEKMFTAKTEADSNLPDDSGIESDSQQNEESGLIMIHGKEYKLYGSVDSEAALTELYYTVPEFNKSHSATNIVKGIVKDVSYEYIQHCPFSVITLEIQESYSGKLAGTVILYEDGGYIPLSALQEDVKGHVDFGLDQDQLDKYVIDMKFMGANHANIGDTMIAYLVPTSSPMPDGSYRYVSSVFGRFILHDNTYIRTNLEVKDEDMKIASGFETTISQNQFEQVLKEIK